MKLKRILSIIVRELLNEQQIAKNNMVFYHGSKSSKISFLSKDNNFGRQLFGYGFYISPDKYESIEHYSLDNNTDGYLYTIKTEKLNTVTWKKPVTNKIQNQVKKIPHFMDLFKEKVDFKDLEFEDNEYEVGDTYYSWDFLEAPLPKWAIDINAKVGYFLEVDEIGKKPKYYYGLTKDEILDFIKNKNNIIFKELKIPDNNIDVVITKDNLFDSFENLYWYITLIFNSTKKASDFFRKIGIDAIYGDDKNINIINPLKIKVINKEKIKQKDYFN